jgi:RNA polymerase sigma-70 factor (ECF subfamily)
MTNNSFDNESHLLADISQGSKRAFEIVYDRYYIGIFYFARRWVRDEKVAEDITVDTFLKLWERFSSFTSLSHVQSFLHVTAKNACLNHLRSRSRRLAHHRDLAYILALEQQVGPVEQDITAQIYDHIHKEIERLPPQVRRVFQLSYIDGLSNQAIAEQLQINNQSVRNHKTNALKYLRMALLEKDLYKLCIFFCLFLSHYFFFFLSTNQ